jgi:hypothetical protein
MGAVREAEELAQHGQSPVAGFRRGGQECLDVAQSTTAQSFLLRWLEITVPWAGGENDGRSRRLVPGDGYP